MKMPDVKYTGSFIKKEAQGSSGPVSLSNSSSKKYYGNMIDAPGFSTGGSTTPAWTRKEGKSKSGGLNAKGRASYKGGTLKAPSKKVGNKRRASFCARMGGMKKKLTSAKTARDPNSRINKSLRAWNC
jgi:hypothetical protein|tara:strand:+ start:539 stop:922 length:384 start_codon:yes stop_codon:yes gene_type:complete